MTIKIPYGREKIDCTVDERELRGVLTSKLHEMKSEGSESDTVERALQNPIGAPLLEDAARGKKHILLITSDHTRPVPSKICMPLMLEHMRKYNKDAEIVILIATGFHRATTDEELREKLGDTIFDNEKIVVHDAQIKEDMVELGVLPSGCRLEVNKLAEWADFIIAEGFIEPHFFAGYSGGRKSILPGIASAVSVMSNHCAKLIGSEYSRTGNLAHNPLHEDMVAASRLAGLDYIVNVVIDGDKKIVSAFAGDPEKAHEKGCEFVGEKCRTERVPADIVLTSNGGHPLDRNVYQSIKSMTAAEACVNDGGVVICVSRCGDGSGGDELYRWFADSNGASDVMKKIESTPAEKTVADQWMAQILARIMLRARVIMVADEVSRDIINGMGMYWTPDIASAIKKAKELKPDYDGITVIPDGISVIIK